LGADAEKLNLSCTDAITRGTHRQKNPKSKKAIATAQHDMHMNNYDKTNMDSNTVQSGFYQCTVNIPCALWIKQNTSTDNDLHLFVLFAS